MTELYRVDAPTNTGAVGDTLNRLQNKLVDAVGALRASPLAPSKVLTSVAIGTSSTEVAHTLGRRVVGWVVVRRDANAVVWESTTQTDRTRFLTLQAGSAVTVDLLVF
jgi:hypothetical protein